VPRVPPGPVADDYVVHPPVAVAQAAQRGLDVRTAAPPSRRGGTAVGLARARQLAVRDPVSIATVKRMLRYFARHLVDREGATWAERGRGWQAWQLWGGNPGVAWAFAVLRRADPAWYARLKATDAGRRLARL
jgi:hypothetical protein